MEARQFKELSRISFCGQSKASYVTDLWDKYDAIIEPEKAKLPPLPGGPIIESGSEDGMRLMRSVGMGMKRFYGYGG